MRPAPPLPSAIASISSSNSRQRGQLQLQHQQTITGSSEYIGTAEIASPTFPPTLQHNNSCPISSELVNRSETLIEQSTLETRDNLDCNIGIAHSATIQPQGPVANNTKAIENSRIHEQCTTSSLHGVITTPSGLVAIVKLPNNTMEKGNGSMISSQNYPGYFEHSVNDTSL